MTLLVLLAAPAGARIVAAYFWLVAPDGFHRSIIAAYSSRGGRRSSRTPGRSGGAGERRLLPRGGKRRRDLGGRVVQHERPPRRGAWRGSPRSGNSHRAIGLLRQNGTDSPHEAHRLFVDSILHRLEQRKALFLV